MIPFCDKTNNLLWSETKSLVKFMFSRKAAKNDDIFTIDLTLIKCQITVKILSIFVAFLENMNFIPLLRQGK